MTIQHLVWLDDAQDPITDAMLAASMQDENDAIFSCTLTRERGALPAMEIELAHPGWSIYAPSHKQAVALVVSEDGTMATARVRARGYVRAMPSAMTGDTLALQVECSPEDWEDRREVVAAALDAADAVATGPWADAKVGATDPSMRYGLGRDTLFGRSQKLADDVAATRTGWWRHDPVDHDVAFVDDAVRARVHNIGDGYDPDSLQVSEGPGAVEQVTWTVYANIQEAHSGTCDIAPMVGRQISSLVGYQTSGSASMGANTGWSVDQPQLAQRYDETLPARTGRIWQVKYRQISYIQVPAPGGGTMTATQYSAERTYDHEERQKRRVQYTQVKSWPARFNFSQTRREKFVLTLDLPVQRVGGLKRTLDLGETTLGDLYRPDIADEDATILTESDGASGFAAGTYAFLAGKLFLATKDTRDTPYVSRVNRRMQVSTALSGDWVDTGLSAPLPDRSAPSFADTNRGQAAVAHALLRMAKAGLARMVWEVQLTVQRADLPDVELEDRVRFLLPSRYDEEPREATGRVTKIVETWSGEEGETVALTLALPLGTGIDEAPPVSRLGSYGGAGYYGADSGYVPQATATQRAGDSIAFTVSADPLVERIVGKALRNPRYSVLRMEITGESREQIADFARAADAGKAPSADVTRPTQVTPTLLPLISERQIEREIRVSGRLLRAERGLDLGT